MSFLNKCNGFLEKYNEIRDKLSNTIKKWFDSEVVFDEKCLQTKIKSDEGKVNINFHNHKMLKKGSHCIYLSVVLIEFCFYNEW